MEMQQGSHYVAYPRSPQNGNHKRLAKALGWFSIGLGLAEVVAPGRLSRLIGMEDREGRRALLRAYGLREIAAGVGILSQPRPSGWVWGRVAGDVLDLASLGSAMSSEDANRTRLAVATAAILGVTALDVYCGRQMKGGSIRVVKAIIVNRSPEEVYSFWQNFDNFPRFMDHLESVEITGDRWSHWKAKTPVGITMEWDSEIISDQPNSLIAWRSVPGSQMEHSGSVRFERAPGGRGTLVRVEMEYAPPGGALGASFAKLFGAEPGQQAESALRLMKQILETGDIMRSDSSIHRGMHPARPTADAPPVTPLGVRAAEAQSLLGCRRGLGAKEEAI